MKKILSFCRHLIGLRSPLRLAYHLGRGVIAYLVSGFPTRGMYIIGVTGTKGKTTTSTLIATALEKSGKTTCLLSTAQVWMAGEKRENHSKMTMDSPFKMWKILHEAREKKVTHVVLETSSHGIYYFRNFGIRYDIVMLTNISQDHLDLHGTMDHYVQTKARLFAPQKDKISVLPRDCAYFDVFQKKAASTGIRPITYSPSQEADYRITHITPRAGGMDLTIHSSHMGGDVLIQTPLVGGFNAENILGAYALLCEAGISPAILVDTWRDFTGAPGRMEPVPNDQGFTVLVDYAHTEQSLRSVLETLKSQDPDKRIITVFGATGDRDVTKRPKMGAVVHALSDIVVVTDDDTYTESSARIIDMICAGIPREIGDDFQVISDRKEAILWALKKAQTGDIVLIAGKGCETAQMTNAGPIPWSDRGIAEEYFRTITSR